MRDYLKEIERGTIQLQDVPLKHRTYEVCLAAVQVEKIHCSPRCLLPILYFAPVEHRTREVCLAAVQRDGDELVYVPQMSPWIEEARIEEAVRQSGLSLYWIPYDQMTPEVCLLAVKQNGRALVYVPEDLKTPELCLVAINQDLTALQFSPYSILELMSMK